jgi:hypothetical protein
LYLPVNDQFSVEILPRDGADKIKIFVKVPYEDGSVEMFNYEEIDSAWHQGQAFTLNIGRNLSDAAINFSNGLTYSPDDRGSFNAKIPSPKNVIGLNQKDGVALRWTKPDYPALAGIKIVRKEGKFPTSIDDGTIVYQGAGNSFKDLLKPQEKGTLFFYSMVAVGADGRISELVHTPVNTGRYALTGQVAFPETMDHQMIHIILKTYAGKVVKTSGVSEDGFFVIPNIIPDEYILECQSGDSTISGTQKYGEKLVMETQTVSVKQGNAQAYFNID